MVIDETGICPACQWAEEKKSRIDWEARKTDFMEILGGGGHQKRRLVDAKTPYGCVVPFSGGKDSATVAWRLREEYGARPLLVCYGQLLWTDVGRRNFHRVSDAGFDILYWRTNQDVSRTLARRFLVERGHPKQHYDAAVNAVPILTAQAFGIPLVVYAEHGESEYGGKILSEESRRTRDLTEVLEHQVGDHPSNWAGVDGITLADLYPYITPDTKGAVTAVYFGYYHRWDIYENAKLARDQLGFEAAQNGPSAWPGGWGRSDGSFEGYDSIDDKIDDLDYYMMHIKFGFGRATRQACRLIQNGHMTRPLGVALARLYDGKFPETYLPEVLDYLRLTRSELTEIIDQHRNPEIWERKDGQWNLSNLPT